MSPEDVARIAAVVTRRMESRLGMLVTRYVMEAANDKTGFQSLKGDGLADDADDGVEHLQPGGLSHVALPGAEGVRLAAGGHVDNPVVVGLANRGARPKNLEPGETVLYTVGDNGGIKIRLLANGDVLITPTGKVRIIGDLRVNGAVVAEGEVTAMAAGGSVNLSQHMINSPMAPLGPPIPGPPVPDT
jgi:phage gp45-like